VTVDELVELIHTYVMMNGGWDRYTQTATFDPTVAANRILEACIQGFACGFNPLQTLIEELQGAISEPR
jgi:hypothetical protein